VLRLGDQSRGGRRSRLTSVRRFFALSRRSLAPRLGIVGRRDGEGGRRASATTAASRARAASLLRNWARCSDAAMVSTPSTRRPFRRSRSRSRWSGERTAEPAASQTSSARESAVFTPCPPGPEDRENRQDSSDSGIVIPESTRRPGRWAAGMNPSSSCPTVAHAGGHLYGLTGDPRRPAAPPFQAHARWPGIATPRRSTVGAVRSKSCGSFTTSVRDAERA
jgi:hypothetical protein